MVETYQQFIGGEFVDSASGEDARRPEPGPRRGDRHRPGQRPGGRRPRGEGGGEGVRDLARDDARRTAASSCSRSPTPSRRGPTSSAALESRNAGKPLGVAIDEMAVCADLFRFFAGACRQMEGKAVTEYIAGHTSLIRRDPIGVVASIAPWNYPMYMAAWKLGPALATGNTVVLKPSARTPLSALDLRRRSPPSSCRPASSTSSPAAAPTSATSWSPTRRSG